MKRTALVALITLGTLGLLFAVQVSPPVIMVSMPQALAPTMNGSFAYDSTNNMLHAAQNGADAMVPQFTITPANNDPVCWLVSGSNFRLGNTGCTGGSSVVQQATVNISSAQIKTLNASPVTIVAAQGAGTYVEFISATVEFVCSSCTQYTSGGVLVFRMGGAYISTNPSAANFDSITTNSIVPFGFNAGATVPLGDKRNTALVFANDTGPEFATGTGTLVIHAQYVVHAGF